MRYRDDLQAEQKSTRVLLEVRVASLVVASETLASAEASFSELLPYLASRAVVLEPASTVFWSLEMILHWARSLWTAQYWVSVVLEESVASLVAAADALAWIAAALVALFLDLESNAVALAARATRASYVAILSQLSSMVSTAEIWLHTVTRVVLDSRVASLVAAADASASMAATLVALFFAFASRAVVLDARSTRAVSLAICLHCDLVEVDELFFLAMAKPAREKRKTAENFILTVERGLGKVKKNKARKYVLKKENGPAEDGKNKVKEEMKNGPAKDE